MINMGAAISEYEVENRFIERLTEIGYEYIDLKNYDDVKDNFRKQICKVNAEKLMETKGVAALSDSEFDRIMLRLEGHTIYESAKILREQYILELDNGKSIYMDFLTPDYNRNTYQVSHQITMDKEHLDDVDQRNRYDVTVFINGLPLVQIELKRPGVELNEAVNQINRYRNKSFRGLFRYIQIFVVSNSVQTKYFANANERNQNGELQQILKSLVFYWTDDANKRINNLIDFTNVFFVRSALTEMLTQYFVIKNREPILMVMRPYQIYAVKKAVDRVLVSDMNGYVFHTTGSGKTLTSYKLASILRDNPQIEKVFFLIDRKDLDDQTVDEYNSFEEGCVDNTENTQMLVHDLQDTKRKLIITTIQKMASALRSAKYASIMDQYKDKKCVFIIDECHRSQFGLMHSSIERHFQKADYIGFTGTPIFKENIGSNARTTADVFKVPNDDKSGTNESKSCIHKYMIKEAIADGNVLPFSVEYMRSIKVNGLEDKKIDPDKIDDADYCKRHNIDISNLYHNPERMKNIADDIMDHLDQHTHPEGKDVYTAIFAIDKIKYLMDYYRYMKENPKAYNKDTNPNGYKIAAIFTYQANEDPEEDGADEYSSDYLQECMNDYNQLFGTDYDISKFDAYRKDIAKRLKQKDLPQVDLLLVVNMFLTGFDSKPTNTLILDKDLVWHTLVQAYSRTNRVDKSTKQFGQIITYRNIKKAQDDALKLFSGDGNPDDYLLQSYDFYMSRYRSETDAIYDIAATPDDAGYLQSEDDQRKFIIAFRQLAKTLATLKTFSKFDWKDLDVFMDEETYQAYKSWYLEYYDRQKRDPKGNPVLADVDFEIELVKTDRINVVYILNLLKDINRNNKDEMEKSIDLILREIDRSDNEKMRYKRDLMKTFIRERFFNLDPNADIIAAYEEYEKESMRARIEEFATEYKLDENLISGMVMDYFMDPRSITDEVIRQKLKDKKLGLIALKKALISINQFIKEMYDLYTTEGD